MTDRDYSCPMLQQATENDDGDLIYERDIPGPEGTSRTVDVNVTKLYSPGRRKSGNVDLLVTEAEMAADGIELNNPAFPTYGEIAEQVHERLGEGVDPAWMTCEVVEFP